MSRSSAYVNVECDGKGSDGKGCVELIECELTMLAPRGSWDERDIDKRLKRYGWTRKDNQDFCKECGGPKPVREKCR